MKVYPKEVTPSPRKQSDALGIRKRCHGIHSHYGPCLLFISYIYFYIYTFCFFYLNQKH